MGSLINEINEKYILYLIAREFMILQYNKYIYIFKFVIFNV